VLSSATLLKRRLRMHRLLSGVCVWRRQVSGVCGVAWLQGHRPVLPDPGATRHADVPHAQPGR